MYRVYPNRRIVYDCTSEILQSVSAVKYIFNFCHYVLWPCVIQYFHSKCLIYYLTDGVNLYQGGLNEKGIELNICRIFSVPLFNNLLNYFPNNS